MKLMTITFLLSLLFFCSCSNTKRITELQNQVQALEKELYVRKHENMELSSFMVSMRKQFAKPFQHYIKICQTDDTNTIEIQK
jgi:predicted membrane protein